MKDRQLLRVKVINGPDDLPKDELKQYHCFTGRGEYYVLSGYTLYKNIYPIDWYLEPIEEPDEPIPCDYLAECIEKAKPNLSKIKDVDKELAEIRGGEQITDADIEAWAKDNSKYMDAYGEESIDYETVSLLKQGAKAVLNGEIKHIK
jgi:hypothetical protein